jgi:hypothetical protein
VALAQLPDPPVAAAAAAAAAGDPYRAEGGALEHRLRRYSPLTGRAGETFDSAAQGDAPLAELMLTGGGAVDVMLEVRAASDPPFAPHNPHEMLLHVAVWAGAGADGSESSDRQSRESSINRPRAGADADAAAAAPSASVSASAGAAAAAASSLVVPGDQLATVASLRAAVAAAFEISDGDFWLVCPTAGSSKADVLVLGPECDVGSPPGVTELEQAGGGGTAAEGGGARLLRRDCGIMSGERLYLERIPTAAAAAAAATSAEPPPQAVSAAAAHFEHAAYCVSIVFNALDSPPDDYPCAMNSCGAPSPLSPLVRRALRSAARAGASVRSRA